MKNLKPVLFSAALISMSACGRPVHQFVGLWSSSGTNTYALNGQTSSVQANENVNVVEGTSTDLLLSISRCNLPADVEGETARLTPGSTCTLNEGAVSATFSFTNGTLVVNKSSATFNANGNLTVTGNGQSVVGTFSMNHVFNKLGK